MVTVIRPPGLEVTVQAASLAGLAP